MPIGLALYLKQDKAKALGVSYRRRSELAREMLERLCGVVQPTRRVLSVQDGDFSTQHFLQGVPDKVDVVGRLPKNSLLYHLPETKAEGRGHKPRKNPAWVPPRRWPSKIKAGCHIRRKLARRFEG